MKTLLVPIDYSEASLKALEVALRIAFRMNAQLLLCHVYQPPVLIADENEPVFALPEYETTREALGRLRNFVKLVKQNESEAVPLKYTAKAGSVVDELLELVKVRKVSMVVMGTRGTTSFLGRFLGTTTEVLVQHAICPVLAVPVNAALGPTSNMVYATSLDPKETDVLRMLVQLKRILNASLTLLHVETDGKRPPPDVAARKNSLRQEFAEEGITFAEVKNHNVAEAIGLFVKESGADLVAFTVARHGFWHDLFRSNIASQLLHKLQITMLALPKHGSLVELTPLENSLNPIS